MENKELYIKKIVNKETERKREFVYVSENVVFNLLKKNTGQRLFLIICLISLFSAVQRLRAILGNSFSVN